MTVTVYPNIEQRSDEWYALRRGIVTASNVGKLIGYDDRNPAEFDCITCGAVVGGPCVSIAKGKTGPLKTYHPPRYAAARDAGPVLTVGGVEDYAFALASERIAGRGDDNYVSNDMWRGILAEPFARDVYAETNSVSVAEVGFVLREEDGWSLGWSPDGLVGGEAAIEIKAPRAKGHIKTIITDQVPDLYMPQCQAALLASGRDRIDFVSYYSGLPLYIKAVTPDPAWFAAIEAACRAVETAIAQILATYYERAAGLPPTERIDFDMEVIVP